MSGLSVEQLLYGEDYKYKEKEEEIESEVKSEVKPTINVDGLIKNYIKLYEEDAEVLNSEKEISEEILDKLAEINEKSFKERTNYDTNYLIKEITMNNGKKFIRYKESEDENVLNARFYSKNAHIKSKNKVTGYGLRVPFIENLACLDVDIKNKKELSKEELKKKSDKLFEFIRKCSFSHVVKTASGGAHIYCNVDTFELNEHEFLRGFASNDEYGFDLFAHDRNCTKHTNSFVMLYESQIKYSDDGEILKYTLEIGNPNEPVKPSLSYVLKCFGIKEKTKDAVKPKTPAKVTVTNSENKTVNNNSYRNKFNKRNVQLTHELLDIILTGYCVEFFGKSGVIHTHTTIEQKNIKERPTIINLISGIKSIELMNNDLESDKQFNINDILNKFSSCEVLTPKARSSIITDYNKFSFDDKNECFVDWMMLVWILKYHAKNYYNCFLSKIFMSNNTKFLSSTTTWDKFLTFKQFDTIADLISKISECVAAVGGNEEFVVRKIKKRKLTLVKHSRTEFVSLANVSVKVKTTKEEREEMKDKKKKVKEYKCFSVETLVRITEYLDKLPKFEECEIYTSDKKVLSLYQPPRPTNYDSQLIKNWLEFVKSLIEPDYFPALNELFSSISYKLRNPDKFIRKFFVQYGKGNDGKSYLISCLATIFSPFCNHGIKFSQMTKDQFNSWTVKLLLLWMEEVQGNRDNVDVLQLSELVKQVTTPQVSTRPMHHECELSNNIGIIGLNTNQRDLKGLTRADWATKSRLVIIKYQGYKNGDALDFEEKCNDFIEHSDFAWSLYYYFMYEYEIPKDFRTNRYDGEEKERFINEANKKRKRPVEAFLSDIKFIEENSEVSDITDNFDECVQNSLCINYKIGKNKNKETVFRFNPLEFKIVYSNWKIENNDYPAIRNILVELEDLGFVKYKIMGKYYYVISKNDFESLIKKIKDECPEMDDDSFNFD